MAQRVWNVGLVSLVFAASVVALEGCSTDDTSTLDTALQVRVERGRYLANNVAICSFCHTPLFSDGSRDWSRHLSGVDCFIDTNSADPEMGCLSTPNLTPAGLGNKTDDQIKALFQNGVRPDGTLLNSVHPYYLFHNMTDEDATALVAYLRSLPPIERTLTERQPPWTTPVAAPPIDPDTIPSPRADYPSRDAALRGRYLVGSAGLCINCHTPNFPRSDPDGYLVLRRDRLLWGGRIFTAQGLGYIVPPYPAMIPTANITPDLETGIGRYSFAELTALFHTGKDRNGDYVCAPTHGGPNAPYAALSDADIEAIAHYLLSISAVVNPVDTSCKAVQ